VIVLLSTNLRYFLHCTMIPPVPLPVPEFAWIWDINAAAPTGGRSKIFGKTRVLPRAQQFSVPTLRQNGDRGIWKGQAQGPQLWKGLIPFYAIHFWSIWDWFSIGFSNDFPLTQAHESNVRPPRGAWVRGVRVPHGIPKSHFRLRKIWSDLGLGWFGDTPMTSMT
jgi:hypothetical protein